MMKPTVSLPDHHILRLDRVTLGYAGIPAVSDVSVTIDQGDFVAVVGPNGSGKSTLLKGILGLLTPMAGQIYIFGNNRPETLAIRRRIGYVPQRHHGQRDFPATVIEVVLMGLYAHIGWWRKPARLHWEKARQALELVGMNDFADRPIGEMSGGQQQRILIARALATQPDLLILDEPTAAVDLYAQHTILTTIERLHHERKITVVMVSHDINEIAHLIDKVLLLNKRMVGFGAPTPVLTKENLVTVYGPRVMVYDHNGHPHVLVGDFDE